MAGQPRPEDVALAGEDRGGGHRNAAFALSALIEGEAEAQLPERALEDAWVGERVADDPPMRDFAA